MYVVSFSSFVSLLSFRNHLKIKSICFDLKMSFAGMDHLVSPLMAETFSSSLLIVEILVVRQLAHFFVDIHFEIRVV